MKQTEIRRLEHELGEYIESFVVGLGRTERRQAMGWYITGLLLDGERKSVEPMAARLVDSEHEIEAMRQRLQQAVSVATWSDNEVYKRLARRFERDLPELDALVLDDTGFPKKGTHSVGVARQYSGTLGRTENCQVATSLHLAGERGSGCIGMRVYLPEEWTKDRKRCSAVGVPDEVGFQRKWEIALDLIDSALSWGVRKHVVLGDAGYGDCVEFRDALTKRGLKYLLHVKSTAMVWEPGTAPKPPKRRKPGEMGRPRTKYTVGVRKPLSIEAFTRKMGRSAFKRVTWREGSRGQQSSHFAAVRIRIAHAYSRGAAPGDEQWLLCEWPRDAKAATKFYLSTLPASTPIKQLVQFAKRRWRIERDYQEMKGEVGLDHFEGRTWRGFHHHTALCAVAHGFLALRRALSPPESTMDFAHRPEGPPARDPEETRDVPAMPSDVRTARRSEALADVIG